MEYCGFLEMSNNELMNIDGGFWAGLGTVLVALGTAVGITIAVVTAPVIAPIAGAAAAVGYIGCNVAIGCGVAEMLGVEF